MRGTDGMIAGDLIVEAGAVVRLSGMIGGEIVLCGGSVERHA